MRIKRAYTHLKPWLLCRMEMGLNLFKFIKLGQTGPSSVRQAHFPQPNRKTPPTYKPIKIKTEGDSRSPDMHAKRPFSGWL